ncbi:MAG: energy-coupling factor ABC transporter permease [Pseudomonadota bacterium]
MHMADALISPPIGVTMLIVSAGLITYSAKKIKADSDEKKIPLMGVLGAFIFASQMINFSIPATGSSGHLGGGMILAILLGPYPAFLVMCSVLLVQALFFADGGLLALGCNMFNLGFFPCFIAYPFVFRKLIKNNFNEKQMLIASLVSAIIALQLGAFCVVLETFFSGISELPFKTFFFMMQPIHLAIGIVEGIVTSAVVIFIWKAKPEIFNSAFNKTSMASTKLKKVIISLLIISALVGAIISWFASSNPDGLEWSMFKTSGHEELETPGNNIYSKAAEIQAKTTFMPDYAFKKDAAKNISTEESPGLWASVDFGTSIAGIVGAALTLIIILFIGFALKKKARLSN